MSDEVKVEDQTQEVQEAQETAVSQAEAEHALNNVAVLKKGATVKGKIVKVDADQAFVDIGYKYDGVIPVRELSSDARSNTAWTRS